MSYLLYDDIVVLLPSPHLAVKRGRTPTSLMKPGSEFLAIDKKTVAIYEAGHAVVALKLGCQFAKLTLERDYSRNLETEKGFRAQFGTGELKGKLNNAARGYSGFVAEMLYEDFETEACDILGYLEYEPISASDKASIESVSPNWRSRAIQLSLTVLKANWTAVRGVAFALHESPAGEIYVLPSFLDQNTWLGLL